MFEVLVARRFVPAENDLPQGLFQSTGALQGFDKVETQVHVVGLEVDRCAQGVEGFGVGAVAAEGGGFKGEGAHPLVDAHGDGEPPQRLAGGVAVALAEFQFGESERDGGGGVACQMVAQARAGAGGVAGQVERAHLVKEALVAVGAFEVGEFLAQAEEAGAVALARGEAGSEAQAFGGARAAEGVEVVEKLEGGAVAAVVGEALREGEGRVGRA